MPAKESSHQKTIIDISPTATGAKLGKILEKEITNDLDKLTIAKTVQKSLENSASGSPIKWKNHITSNEGDVIPFPTYKDSTGRYCRELVLTYIHKGKSLYYATTGCRHKTGQWEIIAAKKGRHF